MPKIKLFCFPYAGGSSSIYNGWRRFLKPEIELIPIELSGRGLRINDPFYNTLDEAVDDVFDLIIDQIKDSQYALFGHSMGSLISYKLAEKIRAGKFRNAKHIFFSGRGAPHLEEINIEKKHLMNEEDFKKVLIALGGTLPELFDHPELLELFLPILKNDFKLIETNMTLYPTEIKPFDIDITVLIGEQENITKVQSEGWKDYSSQHCSVQYFRGGHFFINHHIKEITELINQTI